MAFIGRFFVVVFAFLVASLAAAFVFEVAVLVPFGRDAAMPDIDHGVFKVMVGFGFFWQSIR